MLLFFLFHLSSACGGKEEANQMYSWYMLVQKPLSECFALRLSPKAAFRTYCQHREVLKEL